MRIYEIFGIGKVEIREKKMVQGNTCVRLSVFLMLIVASMTAAASDLECNLDYAECQSKARERPPGNPCDKAKRCMALATCELNYCVCRRAGSGHLGGGSHEVDPAALFEARSMCGLTHGRAGKCDDLAMECADYMQEKHQAAQQHQQQGGSHSGQPKPKPKPHGKPQKPDAPDCNPNFDPKNTSGPDDQPCL